MDARVEPQIKCADEHTKLNAALNSKRRALRKDSRFGFPAFRPTSPSWRRKVARSDSPFELGAAVASFPDYGSAICNTQGFGSTSVSREARRSLRGDGAYSPTSRREERSAVEAHACVEPASPQGLMSPRIGATVPARPVGGLDA